MRNSQKKSHQENIKRLPIASSVSSLMSMRGTEMPVRMEIAKRPTPVLIKGIKKREPTCCKESTLATTLEKTLAASKKVKLKTELPCDAVTLLRDIPEGNKIFSETSALICSLQYHSQQLRCTNN